MRKYRKLLVLAILLFLAGGVIWLYWAWQAPPRIVRLLPDGDVLVYADLRPLRLVDWTKSRPLQLEGDYQKFVQETGIRFEQDLNQVAIGLRNKASGSEPESSAVFVGHFDSAKLQDYLRSLTSRTEQYDNRTVYLVPHEDRTVRVCLLDPETVAVTNMADPGVINGMIERWTHPAKGPELLGEYYRHIPAGSVGWLIDRFPPNPKTTQLTGGLDWSLLENKVAVLSVRYNGNLLLRADIFAGTENDARQLLDSGTSMLALFRSISRSESRGNDKDVKAAFDSIQLKQEDTRVVITASVPQAFLKKVVE